MSSKSSKQIIAVAVIALVIGAAIGFFGAGQLAPSPGQASTVTQTLTMTGAQTARPIKIGMTISQGGAFAPLDSGYVAFNKAWADWVNSQGGLYASADGLKHPVQIISSDDNSDPQIAVNQYTKFATQDGVDFLVSPYSADIGLKLIPIAENNHVPLIMAEASTAQMWNQGFKWITTDMVPYWQTDSSGWSAAYFNMEKQAGWAKTIALVGWQITWAIDDYTSALTLAKNAGLRIVYNVTLAPQFANPDFSAQITQLKALKPDIVYLAMFGPFSAIFISQAAQAGYQPKEWHAIEFGASWFKQLGPLAEHTTTEVFWTPSFSFYQSDVLKTLLNTAGLRWEDWQNVELRMIIFQMVTAAVERAATLDRAGFNDALHSLQIMTAGGPLIVQPAGYGTIGLIPIQVQSGKIVTVWGTFADSTYVHP